MRKQIPRTYGGVAPHRNPFFLVAGAAFIIWAACGCTALWEGTARQAHQVTISETRNTDAAPTSKDKVVRYYDADGVLEREETEPIFAVAAPMSKSVVIKSDSEDAILGLKTYTDAQGSSYGVDRTGQGNAETLGLTTGAQVARTQLQADMVGNIAGSVAKGVVEGLLPHLSFKEEQKTVRRVDSNATMVRLSEIEAAKPEEGGHE